jgi:serine/threonine-protein kinase
MGRLLDFLRGSTSPLDDYEFAELVAEGGMGRVWKARHRDTGRTYAIKLMKPETAETREKFRRIWAADEGQIALKLKHRNVVETYEYGEDNDRYYVIMEFIDGRNVAELICYRPGCVQQHRFDIVVQSGRGLGYLHSQGLIHRDFCPKNILFDSSDTAKLIDFGLTIPAVKRPESKMDLAGTASYMAPEQIRRTGVDARSDIYAFGVSAFEILTGERPFPASESQEKKLTKHLNVEPRRLTDMDPDLPQELEDTVAKCMEKDPDARYNSMEEVLKHVVRATKHAPTSEASGGNETA